MKIILWRHAQAEEGHDDLARELTLKGHRQAAKMAAILRKKLPENFRLWVSEAMRSQQTAAHLGGNFEVLSALNPEIMADTLPQLLQGIHDNDTVVIVGHQPWIGQLCAYMLNRCWHSENNDWSVKKGSFWWFESKLVEGEFHSKLISVMTPK